jgi:hypothetical protein
MDANELSLLLNDLNEKLTGEDLLTLMKQMDKDKSGFIGMSTTDKVCKIRSWFTEFDEFADAMTKHFRRFAEGEVRRPR